jgi:hypothetical protein
MIFRNNGRTQRVALFEGIFQFSKKSGNPFTCISIMARNLIPMGIYNEFFFGSKTNNNIKIFMANL